MADQLPPGHTDKALSYSNVGMVSFHWGHYELAFQFYEKAMEVREQVHFQCTCEQTAST